MAEIKRTFSASKMNKDIDERLVPKAEYRDALNIEVNTSEGSNVGTVQTVLGNSVVTTHVPTGSMCVGSISDTKTDKIYWLVAGASSTTNNVTTYKDYILEYDVQNDTTKYVVVDIYKVEIQTAALQSSSTAGFLYAPEVSGIETYNNTGIRLDMRIQSTTGPTVIDLSQDWTVQDIQFDTNKWKILFDSPQFTNGFTTNNDQTVTFTSDRILNFDSSRLITGINILDGMLFWTDDYSEPKKINIERSIAGTGGVQYLQGGSVAGYASTVLSPPRQTFSGDTDTFHTRLVSSKDGVNLEVMTDRLKQKAVWLEEEHITVLKKAPLTPPYLEMSSTEAERVDGSGTANPIFTTLPNYAFTKTVNNLTSLLEVDGVSYSGADALNFSTGVDFRVGDIIILTNNQSASPSSFVDHEVRIRIDATPNVPLGTAASGLYSWSLLGISTLLGTAVENWSVRLLQSKPMFEYDFVRFAYRYKYKDGEYSSISPFSEPAFLPEDFNYSPKQGYNLGMVNNVRSLKVTDYVVEDAARGRDVVEVDILLKKENSPNIYTVKTIKPTDKNPIWPDKFNYAYNRGEYEVESELIHALLPSNQLLRPWDNVPIKAKAQDITANRLIYGNYVQNYDVINKLGGEQIVPDIRVSLQSSLGDLANGVANAIPTPSKSVKTLRTYQVGVVYRDIYGRETPVLAGDNVTSTIEVGKEESVAFNKLKVQMPAPAEPPYWADSYKFFVKETSNEYYNLAMDRWYDAEDGNIWLSFASADRNKIQEDTYLILKKRHNNNIAVTDDARYRAIAVENEAPEFIKRNTKLLGKIDNDAVGPLFIATNAGFPFEDFTSFLVDEDAFNEKYFEGANGIDQEAKNLMHNGFLFFRIGKNVTGELTKWYKIANLTSGSTASTVEITLDGKFGEEINFASPLQTTADIQSDLYIELASKIPENKAEFDGKFFVKIYKDLILEDNVLAFTGTELEYSIVNSMGVYYVNYTTPNGGTNDLINALNSGQNATYNILPKSTTTTDLAAGSLEVNGMSSGPSGLSGANGNLRQATKNWWRAFGFGWFIDSAITANEDWATDNATIGNQHFQTTSINSNNVEGNPDNSISSGSHGVYEITSSNDQGTSITGIGKGINISASGLYPPGETVESAQDNPVQSPAPDNKPETFDVGGNIHTSQASIVNLIETVGTKFRFREDPDDHVYEIKATNRVNKLYNWDNTNTTGTASFENCANKRLRYELIVENVISGLGIGEDGQGYNPITTDVSGNSAWSAATSGPQGSVAIDFVTEFNQDEDQVTSTNPAIWETEPKEDIGLDIYYEASPAYPVDINARTNEQFAKIGCVVVNETAVSTASAWASTIKVQSWSAVAVTLDTAIPHAVVAGDIISFTAPDGGVTRLVAKTAVASGAQTIEFENTPHEQMVTLPYSNCYSFQNGVESNRIRDDYNAIYLKNGVKASTVLAKHYEQERRGSGLIHSGIYNSTSGTNDLNQFLQAQPITKDLNPRHGSIQKLLNRNTDLVAITEDKCFKIMADKDALFNADGSSQLIASNKVLGQATPYAGDFGTTNPESFAQDNFRSYFVDRTRGKVCRLSMDGITPISSAGMHDWFADNLKVGTGTYKTTVDKVVGSFDAKKQLYNVTIEQKNSAIRGSSYESPIDTYYTLSYSETAKGWVSFKSFYPESGLSINNDYYTFKDGEMWKHHTNETRNNFYGAQYDSDVTVMFNDQPGSIKSFNTINYEGSQAKITQHKLTSNVTDANGGNVSQQDGEYYNLNARTGWYVDSFETNEQSATVPEFIEKEGKWFNNIRGVATTHTNDSVDLSVTSTNLDQQEFSVQGIGVAATITSDEVTNNQYKFKVTNNTSTSYNPDTERDGNTDGDPDGIWDVPPGD